MKICPKCKIQKKYDDFYNNKNRKDNKCYLCKPCDNERKREQYKKPEVRKKHNICTSLYRKTINGKKNALKGRLKNLYGIMVEDYDKLFNSQNGLCAICGKKEVWIDVRTGTLARLAIDHDHKNGKIRGLLCRKCNAGLGSFKDNADILDKASVYVRKHSRPSGNTGADPDPVMVVH